MSAVESQKGNLVYFVMAGEDDKPFRVKIRDPSFANWQTIQFALLGDIVADLFGIKFVASPKHADALLITGPLTRNMKIPLQRAFKNVPEPKFVITCGDCAKDGGIYKDSYAVSNGVWNTVPVLIHIPGCPPEPLDFMKGILKALKTVKNEKNR